MLHNRLNPILTITVSLTTMGSGVILIPWLTSLVTLLTVTFLCTIEGGMIDNSLSVLMLHMWGKEGQPYMQALHFSYGFGAFVAPVLASPYLSGGEVPISGLTRDLATSLNDCNPEALLIYIPYTIIGACCLGVASVFAYFSCYHRHTEEHPSRLVDVDDSAKVNSSVWAKRTVILLAGLFIFSLLGFEIGMVSFITSFAVSSDLALSEQVGAYMTSLYWLTYTFFRLFVIAFINRISITLNITIELIILITANIFLLPFGNSVEWCLWVGIALTGIGMSTVWASTFGLLESHFPITSGTASFLVISGCVGEWVYPSIMGYAVETDSQLFLWTILACTVICCTFFAALCLALKKLVSCQSSNATKTLFSATADYGAVSEDPKSSA
ncbi:hypothetical protein HDE_01056 [Halotydeus destructor]|nr:hypothetical protein HDE_01056 [Halotydeus destructor]